LVKFCRDKIDSSFFKTLSQDILEISLQVRRSLVFWAYEKPSSTHEGPFSLQAEEIDSGQFMTVSEALELSTREPFTPDGLEILQKLGGKFDR
jgi:hypothetical protein